MEPNASNNSRDIFQRELSEVLLLLDFVSGRQDRKLEDLVINAPVAARKNGVAEAPLSENGCIKFCYFDVIKKIVAIRREDRSKSMSDWEISLLMCARDKLNSMIYPARGLTIAYTELFVGQSEKHVEGGRYDLAMRAYPALRDHAARFKKMYTAAILVSIALLIILGTMFCTVAHGVQLIEKFGENRRGLIDIEQKMYVEYQNNNNRAKQYSSKVGWAGYCGYKPSNYKPPDADRNPNKVEQDDVKTGVGEEITPSMTSLCNEWSFYQARYDVDINDVYYFFKTGYVNLIMSALPTYVSQHSCDEEQKNCGRQEYVQSVATVLSTYTNYLFPIFFAVLGALASMLRAILDSVRDSTLSPRDYTRMFVRCILGSMSGLAVGLFFSPSEIAMEISAGHPGFALSAAGVGFLVGYGSDRFFSMLDKIISQVFSFNQTDRKRRN